MWENEPVQAIRSRRDGERKWVKAIDEAYLTTEAIQMGDLLDSWTQFEYCQRSAKYWGRSKSAQEEIK